jgi:hypothetical protein
MEPAIGVGWQCLEEEMEQLSCHPQELPPPFSALGSVITT